MKLEVTNEQITLDGTSITISEAKELSSDLELAVIDANKQLGERPSLNAVRLCSYCSEPMGMEHTIECPKRRKEEIAFQL